MPPQLPLDLPHDSAQSREDLIESPANAIAIAMIDAWPDWPGQVTVLAGPVGSGKTHLASVWAATADAIVLETREIGTDVSRLIDHVANGRNLAIENAGIEKFDETALFHLLNAIREAGGSCLITSRIWPRQWQVELKDLRSRLMAAQLVELQEPDDELLRAVIAKLFADRQLQVTPHVIDYCVLRMERSLDTASRLVARMDDEALARKSLITRSIAAEALRLLERTSQD